MSFFLLPMEGAGTKADPRREKYIPALGVARAIVDHDDVAVVWADTSPAQEAVLVLNPDVFLVPALDQQIALTATQNALETFNIPAQWVTAGMTYREVLRGIIGMAQLIQRTQGLGVKFRLAGKLDRTIGSLAANVQQVLADAADSMGLDRSNVTGATTVRSALWILGKQFLDGRGVQLADL